MPEVSNSKRYVFDIDGVICSEVGGEYEKAEPIQKNINKINKLYDQGHTIIFQTARGTMTSKNWLALTGKQLKDWGVKYHILVFDKAYGDYYIDNKSINSNEFFK